MFMVFFLYYKYKDNKMIFKTWFFHWLEKKS